MFVRVPSTRIVRKSSASPFAEYCLEVYDFDREGAAGMLGPEHVEERTGGELSAAREQHERARPHIVWVRWSSFKALIGEIDWAVMGSVAKQHAAAFGLVPQHSWPAAASFDKALLVERARAMETLLQALLEAYRQAADSLPPVMRAFLFEGLLELHGLHTRPSLVDLRHRPPLPLAAQPPNNVASTILGPWRDDAAHEEAGRPSSPTSSDRSGRGVVGGPSHFYQIPASPRSSPRQPRAQNHRDTRIYSRPDEGQRASEATTPLSAARATATRTTATAIATARTRAAAAMRTLVTHSSYSPRTRAVLMALTLALVLGGVLVVPLLHATGEASPDSRRLGEGAAAPGGAKHAFARFAARRKFALSWAHDTHFPTAIVQQGSHERPAHQRVVKAKAPASPARPTKATKRPKGRMGRSEGRPRRGASSRAAVSASAALADAADDWPQLLAAANYRLREASRETLGSAVARLGRFAGGTAAATAWTRSMLRARAKAAARLTERSAEAAYAGLVVCASGARASVARAAFVSSDVLSLAISGSARAVRVAAKDVASVVHSAQAWSAAASKKAAARARAAAQSAQKASLVAGATGAAAVAKAAREVSQGAERAARAASAAAVQSRNVAVAKATSGARAVAHALDTTSRAARVGGATAGHAVSARSHAAVHVVRRGVTSVGETWRAELARRCPCPGCPCG